MRLALSVLLLLTFVAGCGSPAATPPAAADCLTQFDPERDYFPVKSTVEHAKNFSLRYEKSYQVLTVEQPYPNAKPETYVLLRCGAPRPDIEDATVVETPIRSLYSASTTHLPLLDDLGQIGVLTGVASSSLVMNEQARARIDAGQVTEYAPNFTVDTEKVVVGKPDLLMTSGYEEPQYAALRAAGIPVVANAEWLETTPLGRAEWLKVMAALTGQEQKAGEIFDRIEQDYRSVAEKAAGVQAKTEVVAGSLLQGTWNMPGGGTYGGTLLRDAGATYPWADPSSKNTLQLSFEEVYTKAGTATVWLTDSPWQTLEDARAADPRHAQLAAFGTGRVWTYHKLVSATGGNDYWERGVTRPDLVLSDLVAILHPDLMPGYETTFYRQVGR
ncbi:iron complex transport system substrate-binding protein [Lentzea fradiae]|uniref:Iron complex transport system substrate-binding protein n=1 Tax=Lentzea fradiae TaxID=200378 RepID=A0A1G7K4E5_9PSEU|nr:ABC transporter substrate-binding protein [Lentzea fradiae]SDF31861.1 iron complex transport system substrate-binding protein [Lentzea fradiae]